MKYVTIAFDIDGTLRCNCTETCQDVNWHIVVLLDAMQRMKNTHVMIWSGGGAEYARQFCTAHLSEAAQGAYYASKLDPSTWKWGKPDIAIDDIQDCELGMINLIVREK